MAKTIEAKNLYKPPFKHECGYIFDADHNMVMMVRGWGRIQYFDNPEKLQDDAADLIAKALTESYGR